MTDVPRTGFRCRRCNRPNAVQHGGNYVEGLMKDRTPGDSVLCGNCKKEIVREIECTADKCEQLELSVDRITGGKR